jgi:hypothetical protein
MENTQPMEGNEFSGALKTAKDAGEKTFSVDGKEYDVEECWSKQMEEELVGGQKKLDKNHNGEIDGQDFKIMKGQKSSEEEDRWCPRCKGNGCEDCGGSGKTKNPSNEEECDECGSSYMEQEEEGGDDFEEMLRGRRRKHSYVDNDGETPDEMGEEKKCCEKCGKEVCECSGGMYESKKKTLRLTETELTKMIAKMVSESIPGLDAAEKAHRESGKENKANISAVEKKIASTMKFDGNDNPEFPKAIGKGEKVARKNTPDQEEEIKKNFAGLENLDYDIEPDEKFKKRLKMAIEGDTTMGNAPTTEPAKIKPSNGGEKGKDSENKGGNVIATPETAKGIEKQVKDRQKDKDNRELYNKQAVPVKSKNINEEVDKMKKMFKYNEKTQ